MLEILIIIGIFTVLGYSLAAAGVVVWVCGKIVYWIVKRLLAWRRRGGG
jgi:hypothetical protein